VEVDVRRLSFLFVSVGAAIALASACVEEIPTGPGNGATGGAGSGGDGGGGTGGQGGTPDEYETVACEGAPTASPGDDVCAVVAGDARLLIVGDVLQPSRVYEQGAVLIEDGAITCVGCECLEQAAGATQVVCPEAVVSPGLIDAHDHVGWMNGKPWVAADENVDPALRWEQRHDWRIGKRQNPAINESGGGATVDEKLYGEVRFALSGATAIFGSGDLAGILRDLDNTGEGESGLQSPGAKYDTFPLGDSNGTQNESGCSGYDIGDAAAGFYDCHAPHVAEGIDAVAKNEFACLTGAGAGSKQVLDERSAIIHGVGLTPAEVSTMAQAGMKLVWSPRSNVSLYGDTAPVTLMDRMGVTIALGTDWLPSGSMNMLRELACAGEMNALYGNYFSDRKLWLMATQGAARALAFDDETGALEAGKAADVAVFARGAEHHYGAVVRGSLPGVALVLRGGEVLTGNAHVVDALEQGCEALDVCGTAKSVCVQRDTGKTLAAVEAAIDPAYPLFFCDTPADEPSCVPARTLAGDSVEGSTSYDGVSSADDPDGDGIADASDNCPTVFNPIRPVDGGAQGDFDGDGEGDACDVCPLEADATDCTGADPDDLDGDGVPNGTDNCPAESNGDQADGDTDGHGDVCDDCPTVPNPGAAACPGTVTTIFAIQDESDPMHPAEGDHVQVECIVTAIGSNTLWCQDEAGGPFSGIAVFFGGGGASYADDMPVEVGHEVRIDADYTEYFDLSELEMPSFTFLAVSTVPAPAVVAAADIATGGGLAEEYEGVLVRVSGVSVTVVNPDAPMDFDETELTGGLRIDDGAYSALDNTFTLGQSFASITGVHSYGFSNFKLLPRSAADLAP
jgi:cytosine/adenosine deaminase-related metal-dependent hydrolase